MNKKTIAKAVAMGLLVAEGAVGDYVLLQLLNNGVTIEVNKVEEAGELVKEQIEAEGEVMLDEDDLSE